MSAPNAYVVTYDGEVELRHVERAGEHLVKLSLYEGATVLLSPSDCQALGLKLVEAGRIASNERDGGER